MNQLSEEQQKRLNEIRESLTAFRPASLGASLMHGYAKELLDLLDGDSQAEPPALLMQPQTVRSDANVRQLFAAWWRVNHPFSWWADERGGEPLPEPDRQMVRDLTEQAFYAAEVLSLTAATAMRDKCVEKVREYLTDCRDEERGIIEAIASELSSLT